MLLIGWPTKSLILAAVLASVSSAARADDCKMFVYADLPVTIEAGRRASVPVTINGHKTSFWLDSGAFFSIMSRAKAAELELTVKPVPAQGFKIIGVGGSADAGYTTIRSFGFAKADLTNMDFIVGGSDAGNGLIGANILAVYDAEFDLAHGSVKLTQARGCKNVNLAHWAPDAPHFTVPLIGNQAGKIHNFRLPVTINGVKIVAELDTGAPQSLLSRHAAEAAGIDLKGPEAAATDGMSGFGRKTISGWSVAVRDVGIGDEHVLATRIDVIDGPIVKSANAPDMLLGADFAMAHHIYVSREQRMIFFTYSGGNPFISVMRPDRRSLGAKPAASGVEAAALPDGMHRVQTVGGSAAEPVGADGFARRASVAMDRHAWTEAIEAYTQAIKLAPIEAGYLRERARAFSANGQVLLARADIDKALLLDPGQYELLGVRGFLKLRGGDRASALADFEAAAKVIPAVSLNVAQLARGFIAVGRPDRAAALLGPVIAVHGDDSKLGELLNQRCWARALANVELVAALDDCTRALKRFGPDPAVYDSRGLVRYRQGNFAGAIADYDTALKSHPKSAWSLFMRSAAKARLDDMAGAKLDRDAAKVARPDIASEVALYGLP